MQKVTPRRLVGAALAVALGGGWLAAAPLATATTSFSFGPRLAGANRYATAAAVATSLGDADNVVLATGQNYPDALAGNSLGLPILLTAPDALPPETIAALDDISPTTVTILGGTAAVSSGVAQQLADLGYEVARIEGADRYATAAAVAAAAAETPLGSVDGRPTAILASGENFPDALAAGPVAWSENVPVLLTPRDALSPRTRSALTDLGITNVVIVGGINAVSTAVADAVAAMPGVTVTRLAGADRSDTAAKIADFAIEKFGFSTSHVDLARGDAYADALAGGPHAGDETAPLLLAATPGVLDGASGANVAWLEAHQDTLSSGHIFGGTAAVSNAVEFRALAAAVPEAGSGASAPTVYAAGNGFFVSTTKQTYYYDANDTFRRNGATISRDQFFQVVSGDDILSVSYSPAAGGVSTFNITSDGTLPTAKPAANATAADAIAVSAALPARNSEATTYTLQRGTFPFPNCSGPASYADVTPTFTGSYTDTGLDAGCYVYRVVTKQPGPGEVTATSPDSDGVTVPTPPGPALAADRGSVVSTDAATEGALGKDDVLVFTFDSTMDAATVSDDGAYVELLDGDGTRVRITCGTQADCTTANVVNGSLPPVTRLTVTLTAAPQLVAGSAGSTYPVTVVAASWKASGRSVDLGRGDVVVGPDEEAPPGFVVG